MGRGSESTGEKSNADEAKLESWQSGHAVFGLMLQTMKFSSWRLHLHDFEKLVQVLVESCTEDNENVAMGFRVMLT